MSDDACARTAQYFDGELGAADEDAALDHLAGCARCQAELGDLIGFDVMLKEPARPPAIAAPAAARARWRALVPIGAALAAAAAVVVYVRVARPTARHEREPVALALAAQRAVEVRFTAPAYAAHRPYGVSRASAGHEELPLAALAALEQRGELATLAAAQASGGEVERARAALAKVAPGPARDADRAAIELLARRPDEALAAADLALAAAPDLIVAHWNRAIALRELGLGLSAAGELDRVAAAAEPGWAAEAAARATALRAPLLDRKAALERFTAAARAMIERTGPPLGLDDVRARPGLTRIYFHDALRGAASAAEVQALAPIAAELDRLAGTDGAGRALARVAKADFAVRAPLAIAYREVALTRAPAGAAAELLARVTKAGPIADDLRLGLVAVTAPQARLDELSALARASGDPWFELFAVRERARALLAAGHADRAEALLREAIAGCDRRAWAQRCGGLAIDLATHYSRVARFPEAEEAAAIALASFAAAGSSQLEDHALTRVAEIQRSRDRWALARATFAEIRARAADNCGTARFAQSGVFVTDVYRDPRHVSSPPPAPDACGLAPELIELGAMVDRARMTDAPADVAAARAWIAAARAHPELALEVDVAEARLDAEQAPDAAARLRVLATRGAGDPALHAWIVTTQVDEAGHRGAWREVIELAAAEVDVPAPATCVLAASVDDNRLTAAAIGPTGAAIGAHAAVATPLAWDGAALVPPALRDALRGCPGVAVIARPPAHGRADLLPPAMPWWFAGQRRGPAPTRAAPHELIVGDAVPPASLGLPALAPLTPPAGAVVLRGPDASRDRVLAELPAATYAELHVHGRVDLAIADESFLALTPAADGRWALTAADLRQTRLGHAPVIVLAACRAAEVAPYLNMRWSLPDAFLAAGAGAVVAPTTDIPDDEAARFFDELRRRIGAGEDPATALAALRAAAPADGWAARVILFR